MKGEATQREKYKEDGKGKGRTLKGRKRQGRKIAIHDKITKMGMK